MGHITFFAKDKQGNLRCLPRDATANLIAAADGATMKLDNQKNGWNGVCVYQVANGDLLTAPSGHWVNDTYIFARMGLRRQLSSQHILTWVDTMMSPQDTSVQLSRWLRKPSNTPL